MMPFLSDLIDHAGEENHGSDPGKDLFALLFFSFFLISALLLLAGGSNPEAVGVNSAESKGVKVEASHLALLDEGPVLRQGKNSWRLPEEAEAASKQLLLTQNGAGEEVLIAESPSSRLPATQLLIGVQALNRAGVTLEFRSVERGGR